MKSLSSRQMSCNDLSSLIDLKQYIFCFFLGNVFIGSTRSKNEDLIQVALILDLSFQFE